MNECVHLMDQMQKKLAKFEENEKFNMKQADMYNDILIKFNGLQYKYNNLHKQLETREDGGTQEETAGSSKEKRAQ